MLCEDTDHRFHSHFTGKEFVMNPNHPLVNYPYNTSIYAHRTSPEQIYLAKRNLNELTTLINRRFDQYSRLLIIRVDLKYKPEVALTVPIEVVQMHREQLLGDKREDPNVFDGWLSYAWGLEWGEKEGWHYHLLVIYNGAIRRDDVGIGLAIQKRWGEITKGYGYCYVCNFDKEKMNKLGQLGIGMIHRDDVPLRINLIERVAAYITKKPIMFHVQSGRTESGGFRCFGRSQMPPQMDHNAPRRGRPTW